MQQDNKKKLIFNSLIIIAIFLLDRFSKLYVLNLAETNGNVDILLTNYLNLYLVWNEGIAFGLLNFEQSELYNLITLLIGIILVIVLIIIIKMQDIRVYFYSIIFGGGAGNLYDRYHYSAVPDFIDLHINNFHWFVFNIADIFISLGVVCLILVELILDKYLKNENK
tara:strand:+ start:182 stop:682 length:501 start_codon:yes stop_codon:yes gene_type:complete